jgi:hypothetical protein
MKKILVLASSPVNQARLRLDKEVRDIQEGLRRANKRISSNLNKDGLFVLMTCVEPC